MLKASVRILYINIGFIQLTDLDSFEIETKNYDSANTPDISSLIIPPLNINKLLDENKNE
ncbi:hypothetical protein SAMN05421834_10395 [Halanaerobium kushneri]|uniref:Uncharacterized protein n=1 Tax=Halanaerobium kushneri TaxID=56779 RepID=A0A1N6RT68_9FIRM|nr:hypothetical protein SAMN05421834_10395 [Halanaerobium kushneri]